MPRAESTIIRTRTSFNGAARDHKRTVSYTQLFKALEQLGYKKVVAPGSHVVFWHPKAKARLFLPIRQGRVFVDAARMNGIYQLIDSGGIASTQEVKDAIEAVQTPTDTPTHFGKKAEIPAVRNSKHKLNGSASRKGTH